MTASTSSAVELVGRVALPDRRKSAKIRTGSAVHMGVVPWLFQRRCMHRSAAFDPGGDCGADVSRAHSIFGKQPHTK
jgi:hypothetical protein